MRKDYPHSGGAGGRIATPRPRRLNQTQTEALIARGDLPGVWDERDPVCRAVQELLISSAKRHRRRQVQDEYSSLEECSAATGVALATLERARERACPALEGGKVRLLPFLRWCVENDVAPEPPTLAQRLEHGRLQNALLRLQLGRARGRYIPVQDVRQLVHDVRESLERFFARLREAAPGGQGESEAASAQRIALETEVLETQARKVEATVRGWMRKARKGKASNSQP